MALFMEHTWGPIREHRVPSQQVTGSALASMLTLHAVEQRAPHSVRRRRAMQVGCFVPAAFASLTPVDRLFTRIGTGDCLETNSSSFMVEMQVGRNAVGKNDPSRWRCR